MNYRLLINRLMHELLSGRYRRVPRIRALTAAEWLGSAKADLMSHPQYLRVVRQQVSYAIEQIRGKPSLWHRRRAARLAAEMGRN